MELDKLTIGQMARINAVSIQALRLYDREGLLKPLIVDESSGYRYYHINQSARLDMIQYMKDYGLTLRKIKEHIKHKNVEDTVEFLKKRYVEIDQEIQDLKYNQKEIGRAIENYQRYENLPKDNQIFIEYVGERYIFKHQSEKNYFDQDGYGYELLLHELKKALISKKLPLTYYRNVGTIMRKENIKPGYLLSDEAFVLVDENFRDSEDVERIPPGMYISMCSGDFYEEMELAERLIAEIEKRDLVIMGDYICEVITEFPAFRENIRDMFFKIQIPIRFK
jgi:DNA-binding transcriptional MerR regulator